VGLLDPPIVPVAYAGALYRQHPESQLATTKAADRAYGHVTLVTRMAAVVLERPALLEAHGARVFWSLWSSVAHGRRAGVPWRDLRAATGALLALARRGPRDVRSSASARVFRLVGVRAGFALQQRGIRSASGSPLPQPLK
jgi:hypothetical protein